MGAVTNSLNEEVTQLLDALNHPLRAEIDRLRLLILASVPELTENVKWNGPNYCINGEDRITMRVQPPGKVQVIFHRGPKKLAQPANRLIDDTSKLLVWKENDRAIATFRNKTDIEKSKSIFVGIVRDWIRATA